MSPINCKELAEFLDGRAIGSFENIISGLNRIEFARKGDITFYSDSKYEKYLATTAASCIIVPENITNQPLPKQCYIIVDNPYKRFISLLDKIESEKQNQGSFIHPTAIIDSTSVIATSAYIGPFCVIEKNCNVGENVILKSGITLYDDVSINNDTLIHSNVVIYSQSQIGRNCIIQAGAVIGSDGFGYIENEDKSFTKIPQLGNVVLEDDVEIGANTTIDRAMVGSTVIGYGTKIDNLVQIAHNVTIGENTGIAGQAGIAGTTKIGRRNRIAGQVGLAGHIETADDVILTAQSGVSKSLTKPGIYFGAPARDMRKGTRIEAVVRNLPEIYDEFLALKKLVMEKLKANNE